MESCITRNVDLNTERSSAGSASVTVAIFMSESKSSSNRRKNLKGKDLQMPETKKNALAKLAKKLKADVRIVRAFKKDLGDKGDEVGGMMIDDIDKASRIVAQLAKVEDQRDGETNSDVLWRCNDCIAKCRAIAEEGEKND